MKIKVTKEVLLAAMIFQAKNDVRYYLNGVFFGAGADRAVCSTDGHKMFVGNHESEITDDVIIKIKGSKFTAFDYAEIDTEECVISYYEEPGNKVSLNLIEVIDGKFPDWKRVLPTETAPVSEIGFNANYLMQIEKAAKIFNPKWLGIKIIPNGSCGGSVVEVSNPTQSAKVIIMPTRL